MTIGILNEDYLTKCFMYLANSMKTMDDVTNTSIHRGLRKDDAHKHNFEYHDDTLLS